MSNKPFVIDLRPVLYISFYSMKYGNVSNRLLCIGIFGKFKYFNL